MAVKLGQVTQTYTAPEDHSWLASAHGADVAKGYTLDADKFLTQFPTGIVPSGVLLGLITATGLAAPYTDAATHGAGTAVPIGFLFTTVDLGGTTAGTAVDQPVAVLWHGRVLTSKLPTGHGVTATAKTALADSNLCQLSLLP